MTGGQTLVPEKAYNVRKDMVINLDDTGVILVPARSCRLAPQGVLAIETVGK